MTKRVVFHIDANSAFLSWTAAHKVLILGEKVDLREIPSAVVGNRTSRHSIILAKSGRPRNTAFTQGSPCFRLWRNAPISRWWSLDYGLYVECSRHMVALLRQVAPAVEQYSIDEAWADMTGTEGLYGPPVQAAEMLRERIHRELGFTVNIGVSSNKLLAKIAGDFQKPNRVHSLFPEEIPGSCGRSQCEICFWLDQLRNGSCAAWGLAPLGSWPMRR